MPECPRRGGAHLLEDWQLHGADYLVFVIDSGGEEVQIALSELGLLLEPSLKDSMIDLKIGHQIFPL